MLSDSIIFILWFALLITYFFFIIVFADHKAKWRLAFLSASIIWGGSLELITELLSAGSCISRKSLFLAWTFYILTFLGGSLILCRKKNLKVIHDFMQVNSVREWIKQIKIHPLVIFSVFILLIAGITAIMSPPNNWDSMTYHMSRVAHWAQNRDVRFYPTTILRQLYYQPFAEYTILHHYVLSQNDRYVNLIQWGGFLGCIVGVSLIAMYLGGSIKVQMVAALITATIPMAILQSSSTQNDLVLSFWVVSYIVFILLITSQNSLLWWILAGISLGLVLLTKATGLFFVIPFSIWLLYDQVKKSKSANIKYITILIVITLMIIMPFFYRSGISDVFALNRQVKNPYPEVAPVFNGNFLPSTIFSNIIRNLSLHFAITSRASLYVENLVKGIHESLNLDVEDRETTIQNTHFTLIWAGFHEDDVGNPLHLLLILVCVVCVILLKKQRQQKMIICYLLLCLSTFVLFSTFLRWQPWNSRLQLSFFILCSPFIAFILIQTFSPRIIWSVISILVVFSLLPLLINVSRPIVGSSSILFTDRITQYFINKTDLEHSYVKAVKSINTMKCKEVGLIIGSDDWEYPFWALFNQSGINSVHIEHVAVTNNTKLFTRGEYHPCAIITTRDLEDLSGETRGYLSQYKLLAIHKPVSIYYQLDR